MAPSQEQPVLQLGLAERAVYKSVDIWKGHWSMRCIGVMIIVYDLDQIIMEIRQAMIVLPVQSSSWVDLYRQAACDHVKGDMLAQQDFILVPRV